jgi:hypothetical protein
MGCGHVSGLCCGRIGRWPRWSPRCECRIKQARSMALENCLAVSHPVVDPLLHRVLLHLVPVGDGPPISPELQPEQPRDKFRL